MLPVIVGDLFHFQDKCLPKPDQVRHQDLRLKFYQAPVRLMSNHVFLKPNAPDKTERAYLAARFSPNTWQCLTRFGYLVHQLIR